MLTNDDMWDGRNPLNYSQSNIANIRKLLTHAWLNSKENEIDWKIVLKIKA